MVRALEAAGRDLTTESFIKATEGLKFEDKIAGAKVDVGADHLGSNIVYISRVEGGSWTIKAETGGGS